MTIKRNARRVSSAPDPKIVSKVDDAAGPGELTGYLAVFGNIDQAGEIIKKGSFARTLSQKLGGDKTIPLMAKHFAHGGDTFECVGSIVEAKEDDYGLWIRAVYSSDPESQGIRTKVNEKHVKGLSVGFYPVRWNERPPEDAEKEALAAALRENVVEFDECELVEGTLTVRPCNELAGVVTSKSDGECPHKKPEGQAPRTGTATTPAAGTAGKSAPAAPASAPAAPVAKIVRTAAEVRREIELLTL